MYHQLLIVRNISAIILVVTFFAAQYARQASYLECKLANYFKTASAQCDCEKILIVDNDRSDPSPMPAPHNHIHVDESYFSPLFTHTTGDYWHDQPTYNICRNARVCEGACHEIYQPPQVI